jgi:putative ABC transport system ATP-binding protein
MIPLPQFVVLVKNLSHSFGKGLLRQTILNDIDLSISSNEIVILRGPSGSGKSTLLSLIGGLRTIQTGSIQVLGQELFGAGENDLRLIRRDIRYIFQTYNLLGSLTAYQNVCITAELSPISNYEAHTRSADILKQIGLGEVLDSYPHQMSGGQR